jgi:hypothetical protein
VLLLGEGSWRPGREVESPAEGEGRSTKGEGGGGGRSTESDSKSRKSDSKSRKVPIQNLRRAILSFFPVFTWSEIFSQRLIYLHGGSTREERGTQRRRRGSRHTAQEERRWRRRRRGRTHRTFSLTSGSLLPLRNNPGDKGGRWISSASHRARPDDETALNLRYVSASSSTSLVEDNLPSPSILTSA